MPVNTENIRRWIEQSDIDYITQYIKAWIPFNAWYNAEYNNLNSDRAKINAIKNRSNSIRNKVNTLLEGNGQESEEFKSVLAALHSELLNNQIDSQIGRIWFNDIVKSQNPENLIDNERIRTIQYFLRRTDGNRLGDVQQMLVVLKDRNGVEFFNYNHTEYNLTHLQADADFLGLTPAQQENVRLCFNRLQPVVITNAIEVHLETQPYNHYPCDAFNFKRDATDAHCPAHIVCKGLIEILYQLRNVLFHGELVPSEQNQNVYKNAYFCLKHLLPSIR